LREHQQYALLAVPAIAFLEAFVGVGLFISGFILLLVCTILYTEQIATLQQILPLAFCGAILSDHCGFYIGRLTGRSFHRTQFASRRSDLFEKAQASIVKYGGWAILFGRFMTPIRSFVPLITGGSGMPALKYSLYDLLACTLWTLALGALVTGLDKLWF